jgi:caa(3)-type oxidase subunit IV
MSDHSTPHADAVVAEPDHAHDAEHMAKHLRGYLIVGAVLIVFTGITVALSYYDFDHKIGKGANFIIAMIVATFKVSLVGAIFMHLKGEKWTIWRFLLFTMFFVAGLFVFSLLHWYDPIFSTHTATH